MLVVEDNADHSELIRRRLGEKGFDVQCCVSAEQALPLLDTVDLVLLDHHLPGMSGLDALRAMRSHAPTAIVMVTGMGSESLAVEAMREGALDYVMKDKTYLANLPQVLERAWMTHDLRSRAQELQRLSLLTASASGRPELIGEIVRGTRRLLRANGCALYTRTDAGVALEASDGIIQDDDTQADRAVVQVSSAEGTPIGLLVVFAGRARPFLPEELELAQAFAAFAGIGLANLERLELERQLVRELQNMVDLRHGIVASISHELRTPLTCIRGFAHTLESHWNELRETQRREFVAKIRAHGCELEELVVRLLDFAAVERGNAGCTLERIGLGPSMTATLESLAPLITGRAIDLDVPEMYVLADPLLLHRTVANLVNNATKYSEPTSPISIAARADGACVRIEVIDEGMGLTAEDAARAFEPFWRSSRVSKNAMRGAGIGLALVQEYVRLMGGEVGLESELGRGARFWFTLREAESTPVVAA